MLLLFFVAWVGVCRKSVTISTPVSSVWWFELILNLLLTRLECAMPLSLNLGCVWNVWNGGGDFSVWFWPAQPGLVFLTLIEWVVCQGHRPQSKRYALCLSDRSVKVWHLLLDYCCRVQRYTGHHNRILILPVYNRRKKCWEVGNLLNYW